MKTLHYLFIFLMFAALSCTKEKLTKATQTGANTFSCKINGKVYVAKNNLFSPGITGALVGTTGNYSFFVTALIYNGNKADYTIDMSVPPNILEGTFNLSKADVIHHINNDIKYLTTGGEINFTHIDYAQRIISGTFAFDAVNTANANDIIHVTDGRFDMKN